MASQGRRLQTRPIAWWRDWHHLHITLGTTPFLVFFLRLSRLSDGLFSSFWTRTAVAPHYWPLACTTFKLQSLLARTCIIRPQKHNGGPLGEKMGRVRSLVSLLLLPHIQLMPTTFWFDNKTIKQIHARARTKQIRRNKISVQNGQWINNLAKVWTS